MTEVMTDGKQDCVCGISCGALEIAAAEMTTDLEVSNGLMKKPCSLTQTDSSLMPHSNEYS